jgi:hemerythrin
MENSMTFIVWNDKVSLEIMALDEDHRELIGLINDIYDSILHRASQANLRSHIERLSRFAAIHFAHEEELAFRASLTLPDAHRKAHQDFALWVDDIHFRYENGLAAEASLQLLNQLKDWLFDHFQLFDKDLAKRFTANLNTRTSQRVHVLSVILEEPTDRVR